MQEWNEICRKVPLGISKCLPTWGMNAQHRVEIGLVKLSCEGGKKFSDCNLQIEYPFFYAPLDQRASFM